MTSYEPAKKNTAFIMYLGLPSQATAAAFQTNPTLAAGDVKVSIDGGALANLATLPVVTPAGGKMVKLALSSTEMNGDNITVVFSDAAGAEWYDTIVEIQTVARQMDDLAYPATSGRSIVVDAAGLVDANVVKLGPSGSGTAQTAGDVGAGTAAIKTQTDKLTFTVANQIDANVLDWKSATAPAMTGDAYARLGAPAGASHAADVAAVKSDTGTILTDVNTGAGAIYTRLGAPAGASIAADIATANTGIAAVPTANANADALLDRSAGIETGLTFRQAMRLFAAALLGKASGLAGTTATYRDTNDSKNRIVATVDADGNRSSVTTDAS